MNLKTRIGSGGKEFDRPLVSVIMGVYNPEEGLLLQSIESIINQTYTNWEMIICNDGSSRNNVSAVLNSVARLDKRIKIIEYSENKGLAFALNECLNCSNGKYIARQDDDDISDPKRFEKQLNFLNKNPQYAFVGTIASVFDDGGVWGKYDLVENPDRRSFLWNSPFIHPSVMFRRSPLLQVGGYRVSPETIRCEDYDLFMTLYSKGFSGHNLQERLYLYRINRNNKIIRPMSTRIQEAKVRARGFKELGLGPVSFIYIAKPLILGIIPGILMRVIRKSRY